MLNCFVVSFLFLFTGDNMLPAQEAHPPDAGEVHHEPGEAKANVDHHDEKTGGPDHAQGESHGADHGESGKKVSVPMGELIGVLIAIVLVFLVIATWDYKNSTKLGEEMQLSHWFWPPLFLIYVAGCYYLGWNNPLVSGGTIVLALLAFLGMKQLHETVFKFGRPGEKVNGFKIYWLILKAFSESTELMAIFLLAPLLCAAGYYASQAGGHSVPHYHVPWAAVLTIVGIMTAAKNAMSEVLKAVDSIERKIGAIPTLILVALLAAITGEPANADIQTAYLLPRMPKDKRKRAVVGIGVAAAIGSGGGLTFFSPPAVIIIWASVMVPVFGWTLMTLLMGVGLIVTAHVIACVLVYARHLEPLGEARKDMKVEGDYTTSNLSLLILALVVIGHILVALPNVMAIAPWLSVVVYGVDIVLGIYCLGVALVNQIGKTFSLHRFEHDILPLLIGGLLIAIDNIGVLADPGVVSGGSHIPLGWIPVEYLAVALALMMFVITGGVSALADNALATKVFIVLPITIAMGLIKGGMSLEEASFIANAGALGVIVGALTWGWITVQGNLPNFPIRKAFSIEAAYWIGVALRTYGWTLAVPAVGLILVVQLILPGIMVPLNITAFHGGGGH